MNFALILAVCGLAVIGTQAQDEARLLVSKNVLNKFIVEEKDLTIEYTIFNVGTSTAFNVILSDGSFPDGDFEIVRGSYQAKWDRLAVSNNVSHVVVVKPLRGGMFNMTAANIKYAPSEESKKVIQGYSSSVGVREIMFHKDYDRWFSPHMLDWLAFGLMTLPSLGIPFLLWYKSKSTYENIKPKKS